MPRQDLDERRRFQFVSELARDRLHTRQQRVIIEISGGIATVTECPPEITVEIRDYDECQAGSDADYCQEGA